MTGSEDRTVRVWSFLTNQLLLSPFGHEYDMTVVMFLPNGHLIATATWNLAGSVPIYDSWWEGGGCALCCGTRD